MTNMTDKPLRTDEPHHVKTGSNIFVLSKNALCDTDQKTEILFYSQCHSKRHDLVV